MNKHIQRYLRRYQNTNEDSYPTRQSDLRDYDQWLSENDLDVLTVDALEIEEYFFDLNDGDYAPKTINSRYVSIQHLYKWLAGIFDEIEESPFENMDKREYSSFIQGSKKSQVTREQISYLSAKKIQDLREHVREPKTRNELLVELMFQTGVRAGEAREIRLKDIDRRERSIRVKAEKTDDNRTVYYKPSLDSLLTVWSGPDGEGGKRMSYLSAADSPYLFNSKKAEQISTEGINDVVKQAAREAGHNEVMYEDQNGKQRWLVTSHTLRHSHAVEALKSGVNIRSVQMQMGHSELETTEKYLDLIGDDVREAYQRFGTR